MPLNKYQRARVATWLRGATDEAVSRPLWDFHPYYRPAVLTERKRRNILQSDPEPIGDPEYS
ncbi:hypothetical protein RKD49_005398 [Streptomyces glaucescens]